MKRSIRVLLAEDNEDHAFLTVRALKDIDGVVIEAEAVRNGEEALDYIHGRGKYDGRPLPHLILLDLKMPKVDGLEVLRYLKAHPELKQIPVVILTASDRPEDIDVSYRLGANSFVTKPVGAGAFRDGLLDLKGYWTELASLPEPPSGTA